ncbi:carboxypeptidase-like regulatory domain-containing protein [Methylobacter sp. G7]|uniref:carboxypeptidase-like regulatory domain-containing protein n=1 Tax=Methylobacter sp. G7 TaxID=3230117 RepID=UPI003D808244
MKRIHLTLIFLCILFSFPAVAEQELIKSQIQGEVTFISGGIGSDEQNALQAIRADYNLHLLFSIKDTGEYVSDVRVRITDSSGNILMETVADGPMLFAKLKPGRYTVTVERRGQVAKQSATIGSTKRTSLSFAWPQEQDN